MGPERGAGRRPQHRLPDRRRGGPAAARPAGSAGRCSPTSPTRGKSITTDYGNVGATTVGAIQRRLVVLEATGRRAFLRRAGARHRTISCAPPATGAVTFNILAADQLMTSPQLYATFLLWLMSELFEDLPEVGDPRQAEARLLLRRGPSPVRRCAARAAREDRAGGAPDPLEGRRRLFRHAEPARRAGHGPGPARQPLQHALRAFTPRDQKAVKAAAEHLRARTPPSTPSTAITELGVGEALVSVLDRKGIDHRCERTMIRPPASRMGPISEAERSPPSRKARSTGFTTNRSIANRPTRS